MGLSGYRWLRMAGALAGCLGMAVLLATGTSAAAENALAPREAAATAKVSISPPGGEYGAGETVTVSVAHADPGTAVFYTLDGTVPTAKSRKVGDGGTLTLTPSAKPVTVTAAAGIGQEPDLSTATAAVFRWPGVPETSRDEAITYTALQNGKAVVSSVMAPPEGAYFYLDVPAGALGFHLRITDVMGDSGTVCVKRGVAGTPVTDWNDSDWSASISEIDDWAQIDLSGQEAGEGRYYIKVDARAMGFSFTLKARYPVLNALGNNLAVDGTTDGGPQYYYLDVPAEAVGFSLRITDAEEDNGGVHLVKGVAGVADIDWNYCDASDWVANGRAYIDLSGQTVTAGRYYIKVDSNYKGGAYTLKAGFNDLTDYGLANGVAVTGDSDGIGSLYYYLDVPAGAAGFYLRFANETGGSGWIYLVKGSAGATGIDWGDYDTFSQIYAGEAAIDLSGQEVTAGRYYLKVDLHYPGGAFTLKAGYKTFIALGDNVAVRGDTADGAEYYCFDVPAGAAGFTLRVANPSSEGYVHLVKGVAGAGAIDWGACDEIAYIRLDGTAIDLSGQAATAGRYYLMVTLYASDGTFTLKAGYQTYTALANGVAVAGSTVDGPRYYHFDAPAGVAGVNFKLAVENSSFCYVRGTAGSEPDWGGAMNHWFGYGSDVFRCVLDGAEAGAGRYYVKVYPTDNGEGGTFTLTATHRSPIALTNKQAVSGSTVNGPMYYYLDVPAGAVSVTPLCAGNVSVGGTRGTAGTLPADWNELPWWNGHELEGTEARAGRYYVRISPPYGEDGGAFTLTVVHQALAALTRGVAVDVPCHFGPQYYYLDVPANSAYAEAVVFNAPVGTETWAVRGVAGTIPTQWYTDQWHDNHEKIGDDSNGWESVLDALSPPAGRYYFKVRPAANDTPLALRAAYSNYAALQNGVAKTATHLPGGLENLFYLDVPAGVRDVSVRTSGPQTNNFDLALIIGTAGVNPQDPYAFPVDYVMSSSKTCNEAITVGGVDAKPGRYYFVLFSEVEEYERSVVPGSTPITITATYTVENALAAPGISPAGGTFPAGSPPAVTLDAATAGITLVYTLDGSTPSATNGTLRFPPATVTLPDATTVLKVVAIKTGLADSPVASAAFVRTAPPPAAVPALSVNGGTFVAGASVKTVLKSATPGASIRYTVDGSLPTETVGTLVANGASVTLPDRSVKLRAVAYKDGFGVSPALVSNLFTRQPATPTLGVNGGTFLYGATVKVVLKSATPGVTLRYTTNGTIPTDAVGTLAANGAAVTLPNQQATLRAVAYKAGLRVSSTVVSKVFYRKVATPSSSVNGGRFAKTATVKTVLKTATPGASIRYTTDGSTPTSAKGTRVANGAAVTLPKKTVTLKFVAYKTGLVGSAVAAKTFTRY